MPNNKPELLEKLEDEIFKLQNKVDLFPNTFKRVNAVHLYLSGETMQVIAEDLKVHPSTISEWYSPFEEKGIKKGMKELYSIEHEPITIDQQKFEQMSLVLNQIRKPENNSKEGKHKKRKKEMPKEGRNLKSRGI